MFLQQTDLEHNFELDSQNRRRSSNPLGSHGQVQDSCKVDPALLHEICPPETFVSLPPSPQRSPPGQTSQSPARWGQGELLSII